MRSGIKSRDSDPKEKRFARDNDPFALHQLTVAK